MNQSEENEIFSGQVKEAQQGAKGNVTILTEEFLPANQDTALILAGIISCIAATVLAILWVTCSKRRKKNRVKKCAEEEEPRPGYYFEEIPRVETRREPTKPATESGSNLAPRETMEAMDPHEWVDKDVNASFYWSKFSRPKNSGTSHEKESTEEDKREPQSGGSTGGNPASKTGAKYEYKMEGHETPPLWRSNFNDAYFPYQNYYSSAFMENMPSLEKCDDSIFYNPSTTASSVAGDEYAPSLKKEEATSERNSEGESVSTSPVAHEETQGGEKTNLLKMKRKSLPRYLEKPRKTEEEKTISFKDEDEEEMMKFPSFQPRYDNDYYSSESGDSRPGSANSLEEKRRSRRERMKKKSAFVPTVAGLERKNSSKGYLNPSSIVASPGKYIKRVVLTPSPREFH
eukprot:Sdes_comp20886_c0_seq1m17943